MRKNGGSDGTRTRGLLRDRAEVGNLLEPLAGTAIRGLTFTPKWGD